MIPLKIHSPYFSSLYDEIMVDSIRSFLSKTVNFLFWSHFAEYLHRTCLLCSFGEDTTPRIQPYNVFRQLTVYTKTTERFGLTRSGSVHEDGDCPRCRGQEDCGDWNPHNRRFRHDQTNRTLQISETHSSKETKLIRFLRQFISQSRCFTVSM